MIKILCSVKKQKLGDIRKHLVIFSPFPDEQFEDVYIDITGPLLPCRGNTYLLICIDCFSCSCKVLTVVDINAHAMEKAFISRWVSQFGDQAVITMDRGQQFKFSLFIFLKSKQIHTTAYHLQSNSLVEWFHYNLNSFEGDAEPIELAWKLCPVRTSYFSEEGCLIFISWDGVWHHAQTSWKILLSISTEDIGW